MSRGQATQYPGAGTFSSPGKRWPTFLVLALVLFAAGIGFAVLSSRGSGRQETATVPEPTKPVAAVVVVTQTTRPTLTPTPSPTRSPTATPLGRKPVGVVVSADNFDSQSQGKLPTVSNQPDKLLVGYSGGEYYITLVDPKYEYVPSVYLPINYADMGIAVDVRFLKDQRQYAAVACRASDSGEYRLKIDPNSRRFAIVEYKDGAQVVPDLVDWTYSAAIKGGVATNRVELYCSGRTISAWANGTMLGSAENSDLSTGVAWIGASCHKGDSFTIDARFDNLAIYRIQP